MRIQSGFNIRLTHFRHSNLRHSFFNYVCDLVSIRGKFPALRPHISSSVPIYMTAILILGFMAINFHESGLTMSSFLVIKSWTSSSSFKWDLALI